MPPASTETRRSLPKKPSAPTPHLESADDSRLTYRQRLNLATPRRGSRRRLAASAQRVATAQFTGHHHGHAAGEEFEFHAASVAEMTAGAELFDDPIHELEELAESVGRYGQRLQIQGYELTKRALDVVLSLIAFVCLSPILFVAAAIVKLTDGGPILYGHTRVGLNGREFRCVKFRSMVQDADAIKADIFELNSHSDSRTFKVQNDPRVTRFGRIMRKLSIDELPQLWNVLIGDMSFVGPRPPVPCEVEQYSLDDMERLTVKPGLTCIWQVSGRSRIAFPEQLQMDLDYIDNRSLLLDLKLLALTVPAVISGDGAY
jgi:lipopolysaccharide/colanic/teichoic acid biosynthesis glycosyltransferase